MNCPRCGADNARLMVKSPVGDAWELFVCETCWYSWRSTETVDVWPVFKLTPDAVPGLQVIPPIPPLA